MRPQNQPLAFLPHDVKFALLARFKEIAAYALLLLAFFAGFALLSWQALDPSSSVMLEKPAANWLGKTGAGFADWNMQLWGFATLPLYVTLGYWGYEAWRKKGFTAFLPRALFLTLALLALSLTFSCLPRFSSWPLGSGYGGALGDSLLRLFAHITGELSGLGKIFLSIPMGILGYKALVAAWLTKGKAVSKRKDDEYEEFERQEISLLSVMLQYFNFKKQGLKDHINERMVKAEPRFTTRTPLENNFNLPPIQDEQYEEYAPAPAPRSLSTRPEQHFVEESPPLAPQSNDYLDREVPLAPIKPLSRMRSTAFDPRKNYEFPALDILAEVKPSERHASMSPEVLKENARLLEGVLDDFGIQGEIINIRPGPVVTLYEFEPAPGIKSARVIGLADDIARSMSATSVRVAVVVGRNVIGIELPNLKRNNVLLREMLASRDFAKANEKLPIALGKTIGGEPVIVDLAKMPHLLVAGTTGSGKSVAINTMILSLLYRLKPEECRLIMIDPKMLELSVYDGIPHLLTPVVTDPKKAVVALKWAVREMEERNKKMSKIGVRGIEGFNARIKEAALKGEVITRSVQTGFDRETGEAIYETEELDLSPLPYIVIIVDEMADLMMVAGKDIEGAIQRLAQMARAAGIHIIMATQRPSVDVITGTIKANFPTRISFQVTSKIDSRTILGEMGAEQLLGRGDMLYMAGGTRPQRVHGPFVADNEVEMVVSHLKTQGVPEYLETVLAEEEGGDEKPQAKGAVMDKGGQSWGDESGDLYDQAVQIVLRDNKCSTSYVQRRLGVGYNKAATLVERMEKEGLVGPSNPTGKREILVEVEQR